MTDEELDRRLREINIAVSPRPEFADDLWARLEAELAEATETNGDVAGFDDGLRQFDADVAPLAVGDAEVEIGPVVVSMRAAARRHRPRRWLTVGLAVAAVIAVVVGIIAVVRRNSPAGVNVDVPPAIVTRPSSPFYLPASVPAGLHQDLKAVSVPAQNQPLATLVKKSGRGFISIYTADTPPPTLIDLAAAVDINGHPGFISFGPVPFTKWNDGTSTYWATSYGGATTDELVTAARGLRVAPDGTAVAVAPPGWKLLPLVPAFDALVRVHYVADTIGDVGVWVWSGGSDVVDQYADHVPGAVKVGNGAQAVVEWNFGTVREMFRKLDDSRYVQVVGNDITDTDLVELARSTAAVTQAEWDASTNQTVHSLPYKPDNTTYAHLITTGATPLDGQPGPNGSTCLRVDNAIDQGTSEQCFTHTNADSVSLTDVASNGTGADQRAVYGTSTGSPTSVVVTLDDGSQITARLVPVPGTKVDAWIADFPKPRLVHSVEARDASSNVLWHAGPPS